MHESTGDAPESFGSWFDLALVSASTRRSLNELAVNTPPVLVALVCELDELAPAAGMLLGERWVTSGDGTQPDTTDTRLLSPESDRWTLDELSIQVLEPAKVSPAFRHVFVIDAADRMDQRLADRLLRLLEEPPSPATFVLCVSSFDALPVTLQGRCEKVVLIESATSSERAEALISAGVARPAAETAIRLAGRAIALAPLLARDAQIASLASRLLDHPAWDSSATPIADADEILALCSQLAASWEAGKLVTRSTERLTPLERAKLRNVVRMGFDRHRSATHALMRRVAAAPPSPVFASVGADGSFPVGRSFVARVEDRAIALSLAERQLSAYTSVRLVLASLLSVTA